MPRGARISSRGSWRPSRRSRWSGRAHGPGVWAPVAADGVRYVASPVRPAAALRGAPCPRCCAPPTAISSTPPSRASARAGIGHLKRLAGPTAACCSTSTTGKWASSSAGAPGARLGRALNLSNPRGLPWTWLMERAARAADGITVASRFLQERFGGVLIPHVRDTDAWRPGLRDPARSAARLGAGRQAARHVPRHRARAQGRGRPRGGDGRPPPPGPRARARRHRSREPRRAAAPRALSRPPPRPAHPVRRGAALHGGGGRDRGAPAGQPGHAAGRCRPSSSTPWRWRVPSSPPASP